MRTPTNNDEEKKLSLLLGKVEALTVDSASDELLAGQLLTGGPRRDAAIAPNLKLVIRDVTHASRRPHILLHGKQNRQWNGKYDLVRCRTLAWCALRARCACRACL